MVGDSHLTRQSPRRSNQKLSSCFKSSACPSIGPQSFALLGHLSQWNKTKFTQLWVSRCSYQLYSQELHVGDNPDILQEANGRTNGVPSIHGVIALRPEGTSCSHLQPLEMTGGKKAQRLLGRRWQIEASVNRETGSQRIHIPSRWEEHRKWEQAVGKIMGSTPAFCLDLGRSWEWWGGPSGLSKWRIRGLRALSILCSASQHLKHPGPYQVSLVDQSGGNSVTLFGWRKEHFPIWEPGINW